MKLTRKLASGATSALLAVGLAAAPSIASAASTGGLTTPAVRPSPTEAIGTSGILTRTVVVKATNCSAAAAKAHHLWWVMDAGNLGDIGDTGWPQLTPTNVGNTATFKATLEVALGNPLAEKRPTALGEQARS